MRATWITSLVAGAVFGAIAAGVNRRTGAVADVILVAALLVTVLIGVFGVPQIREILEERKKRGLGMFGVMIERSDFSRFYFPTWGRMFVWFCATVVGVTAWKALVD